MSRGGGGGMKRYSNNNNFAGMGGEYFETDYAAPSRYYNNRGGPRGGARKNMAPRFCYVNADFLGTHGLNEFPQGGFRRRGGWESNRYQLDNRFSAASSSSPGIGRDSMIADISVTVPTGGKRVSSAEGEDDRDEDYGNKRKRHKSGGGGGNNSSVRKSYNNNNNNNKRHNRKPERKRHHPSGEESGDAEVEVLERWSDGDEDEDLRLTIVRQKMKGGRGKSREGNNNGSLRREPGEILDTDEGSPASSPEGKGKKAVAKKGKAKARLGAQVQLLKPQTIDDANTNVTPSCDNDNAHAHVETEGQERPVVVDSNSRPITAETLSQDTLPSLDSTSHSVDNKTSEESQQEAEIVLHNDSASLEDSANTSVDADAINLLSGPAQDSTDDDVVVLSPSPSDKEKNSNINIGSIDLNAYDDVSAFQGRQTPFHGTEKREGGELDQEKAISARPRSAPVPTGKKSLAPPTQLKRGKGELSVDDIGLVPLEHYWRNQSIRLKKHVTFLTGQMKTKDETIANLKTAAKGIEEKESKIKALRGRKTQMENEIEELKKSITKLEKQCKESELKCKLTEAEIHKRNEEIEGLKREKEVSVDPNKQPDVQLIYAMAYQDRLYVEVEKVKSAFEVEILKLQEYYESRLSYFRNHGINPGPFMGAPGGNSFPKGCLVTPLNISQQMAVANGHQDQGGQRGENRANQPTPMGMFAHLGPPDSITPSTYGFPSVLPRGRVPVFLNPMFRRMQPAESGNGPAPAVGSGSSNNNTQNAGSSNTNANTATSSTSTTTTGSQQQAGQSQSQTSSGTKSSSSGSSQNTAFGNYR